MKEDKKSPFLAFAAALLILAVLMIFKIFDATGTDSLKAVSIPGTQTVMNRETPEADAGGMININTATVEELATLDEVGEVKARAIVGFRERYGNFRSVDELTLVDGVGEIALEANRGRLTVE
ncbi:MAG: ComEA family DNA-binding protein [Clostridia bacterium]|nr:ComEA family DNA-binding protein [Clostridia bacterium]